MEDIDGGLHPAVDGQGLDEDEGEVVAEAFVACPEPEHCYLLQSGLSGLMPGSKLGICFSILILSSMAVLISVTMCSRPTIRLLVCTHYGPARHYSQAFSFLFFFFFFFFFFFWGGGGGGGLYYHF